MMRALSVRIPSVVATTILGLTLGCDAYPEVSSSLEEATVKGTVTVSGKPVNNGTITFRSANVRRPTAKARDAAIAKDGTYSVTTLVGQNQVEVDCKELHTAKNKRLLGNETLVQVQSGENTIDISLSAKK